MPLPQPGKVQKVFTNITLSSENDISFGGPTTVSGYRFLYNGSQFCLSEYDTNTHKREMNVWSNDGLVATNFFFQNKYILDVFFDNNDSVYYGIRWNNDYSSRGGGFTFTPETEGGVESAFVAISDDFNVERDWHIKGVPFIRTYRRIDYNPPTRNLIEERKKRWVGLSKRVYNDISNINFSSWGVEGNFSSSTSSPTSLLEVDEDNNRLVYFSNNGTGYLGFDVDITGNFVSFVDLNVTTYDTDCVISFRVLRQGDRAEDPFNQLASITYRGPESDPRLQCWTVDYINDSSGLYWSQSNVRISEKYLDSSATGSVVSVTSNAFETFKVKVENYASYSDSSKSEHAVGFSVKDSVGTNFGYGAFGTNTKVQRVDSFVYYGDEQRVSSWVDNGFKVMGFDIRSGYDFDTVDGIYTDYIDSDIVGSSKEIKVGMLKEGSAPGIDNDKLRLAIKRVGTTIYFMKRDNTVSGGSYTVIHSLDLSYSGPVRFELYADSTASSLPPDISVGKFVVRGLFPSEVNGLGADIGVSWPHPVFTLESYDVDGNKVESTDVSDTFGNVLPKFDIIKKGVDSGGDFSDYLGKVQIASNHGNTSASGEVFINVNTDFYKYLKDALPINAIETGSNASVVTSGTLFGTPYYNTLDWNMYTEGGLIYAAVNEADPGDGIYMNVIRHTTMGPNDPVKFAWLDSSDPVYVFYGVDVNEPNLLYGFSQFDRKIYIYNMNEDSSAFCNVVSQKQIVGANTAETSSVTAQVVNVYGDPLQGKTVNFSVSSGDGSVSPSSDITDALGEAQTTYTVGSTVGVSRIRATVID